MTFQPNARPGRMPTDAHAAVFENVDISLFDLFRACMTGDQPLLTGRTFRNCRIDGPAVMLVLDGTRFEHTDFGFADDDIRNLLLRPVGPTKVTGTIPVHNCLFTGCEFFAVGFTGPEPFLQQVMTLDTKR